MKSLLIKNIGLLQTPQGSFTHQGDLQGENLKIKNAAIVSVDGIIQDIYSDGELPEDEDDFDMIIDAEGSFVTPGLIDGHTHMVFGGYRQQEIHLKLSGASYLDILKDGGGILETVRKTREAFYEELEEKTRGLLDEMIGLGVTTCEAKSGYCLDMDNEVKVLELLKELDETHTMDIVATYMGAHAIPSEYNGKPDEYLKEVCNKAMDYIWEEKLAKYVDVFW